jgi:hypothetical protein
MKSAVVGGSFAYLRIIQGQQSRPNKWSDEEARPEQKVK